MKVSPLYLLLASVAPTAMAGAANVYCDCNLNASDPCTCYEPDSSSITVDDPAYTGGGNGHFNVEGWNDRSIYIYCQNNHSIASTWKISHTGSGVTCYNKNVGNPTQIQCKNSSPSSHKVHLDYYECDVPVSEADELTTSQIHTTDSDEVRIEDAGGNRKLGSSSDNHCDCNLSANNPCTCYQPGSSHITADDPAYTGKNKLKVAPLKYASFYLYCDNNPSALATNAKVDESSSSDLKCGPKDVGNPTQYQCYNKSPVASHHIELKHYDCQTNFTRRALRGSSGWA